MKRWPLAACVLALTLVLLLPHSAAAQCAMCRRALTSPEGQRMVAAFREGILFLLAAPFLVFGTIATMAIRKFRQR
jgi:hypothetical protein